MTGRYELSSQRWALIEDIVSPPQTMGRPRRDDRQMLNGIFWILCSGAKWRDLPERYGPWKTVYQRFRQWRDDGTFERVLTRLHLRLRQDGFIDLDTWMVDSTTIRATRAAAGGGKKGPGRTCRSLPGTQPGWVRYQDSPALRCQWLSAELYPLAWSAGRFAQLYSVTRSGASPWLSGQTTQALPDSDRGQGLR